MGMHTAGKRASLSPELFIGIVLAAEDFLIVILLSVKHYLLDLRLAPADWFAINSCNPSTFLFVLATALQNRLLACLSAPPMAFYGIVGFYAFPWDPRLPSVQISHVLMVLSALYAVIITFLRREYRTLVIGLLLGIALLVSYHGFRSSWIRSHPTARAALHRESGGRIPSGPWPDRQDGRPPAAPSPVRP